MKSVFAKGFSCAEALIAAPACRAPCSRVCDGLLDFLNLGIGNPDIAKDGAHSTPHFVDGKFFARVLLGIWGFEVVP